MPVYQVYDNLERVLNRVYSDDYDMKENCVPTGQDFSVKVGGRDVPGKSWTL